MIAIGKTNVLVITRQSDYGLYLAAADTPSREVLLPTRYVTPQMHIGDSIEVFVYNDSADRPVATTDMPAAQVGQCAFLRVTDVNDIGAFLDWGLPKDLLVPFAEQKARMRVGGTYPVYIYLDHATQRIAATAKIERYIGNTIPTYQRGDEVSCLVESITDIGYKVIVDDLHHGMIYLNETYAELHRGQLVKAHVKRIRPDFKIDLTIGGKAPDRVEALARSIISRLHANAGVLHITDASPAPVISATFACSKRDFKKAIGKLYKDRRITISDTEIRLATLPSTK
ncbi:MAG: S1 RNA-binding domain-containing protein [Muribaculaceae bacterium]